MSAAKRPIRIATRGSKLALWQADFVKKLLGDAGHESSIIVFKTTGDVTDGPLHAHGGKGLFVKELERALQDNQADVAIHSLKDVPVEVASGLTLAAFLPRHSPRDVLILSPHALTKGPLPLIYHGSDIADLGPVSIATGSLRRSALLKSVNPKLAPVPLRGNVDTRIRKLSENADWHGIILAEASLARLGLDQSRSIPLAPEWFIPCAGQGILALECRADDSSTRAAASSLGDVNAARAAGLERALLRKLGGDCSMPFGAWADISGQTIIMHATVLTPDGQEARTKWQGPAATTDSAIVAAIVESLMQRGLKDILNQLNCQMLP